MSGLACSAAVGVGFYGNSETSDGVYQLIYSLDNANHTLSGIDRLVRFTGGWLGRAQPRGQRGQSKNPGQILGSSAPRGARLPETLRGALWALASRHYESSWGLGGKDCVRLAEMWGFQGREEPLCEPLAWVAEAERAGSPGFLKCRPGPPAYCHLR